MSEDPNPPVANNGETTEKLIGGVTGKGFMPGQSGNPNGRPRRALVDDALEELLLTNDSGEAKAIARALVDRAKNGDVKAAQLVTERTQGKPRQSLAVLGGVDHDGLAQTLARARERANMSDDDLRSQLTRLRIEMGLESGGSE